MSSRSLLDLKAFTYGAVNGVVSGQTNYTKGKLLTAARWNYAPDPLHPEEDVYIVTEQYAYLDPAGRKTNRTTTIDRSVEGDVERVRAIEQRVAYNDLSLPERIDYPTCVYCTFSGTKAVTSSYSAGKLQQLSRINSANTSMDVAEIGYFPNGMAKSILHFNQVRDTIELDNTKMARPKRIRFEPWQRCTQPAWAAIAASPEWSVTPGQAVTLTATYGPSTTSAPISFHWSVVEANGAWTPVGGNTAALTVTPSGTTTYVVRVENPCQSADSAPATVDGPAVAEAMATVTVSGCEAPAIDTEPPAALAAQAGASVTLSVTALGTQPLSYAWYALDQPSLVLGTDRTLTIPSIARTTRFACRITNACGQVTSGTAVVSVPLPAPGSLTATRTGAQAIALSWSAAAGAHHYNVERMTGGGAFAQIGTPAQTTFTDGAVTTGVTYVYRVVAAAATAGSESVPSNRDLATTMAFQSAAPGSPVDDGYFHELLAALNALHAANGWPAATWSSILPSGVPAPGPGVVIRAAHLAALRDHMNLARQALGVASGSYADDPIVNAVTPIRAAQITAVQQRAQ